MAEADFSTPIGSHLDELRRRLFRIVIVVAMTATIAFIGSPWLFRFFLRPYHAFLEKMQPAVSAAGGSPPAGWRAGASGGGAAMLQTLQPAETFRMSVQLSLLLAVVIVLPYLLWEVWSFLRPGLTAKERRWLAPALAFGSGLFCCGAGFAYCAVLPIGLRFFWEYSLRLGVTPAWSVANYIGFVVSTMAAFGLSFELPLVIAILAAIGLVTPQTLTSKRRHAYFLIAVLAAALTPPDVISMTLMGLPLLVLYELAIWLARLVTRRSGAPSTCAVP